MAAIEHVLLSTEQYNRLLQRIKNCKDQKANSVNSEQEGASQDSPSPQNAKVNPDSMTGKVFSQNVSPQLPTHDMHQTESPDHKGNTIVDKKAENAKNTTAQPTQPTQPTQQTSSRAAENKTNKKQNMPRTGVPGTQKLSTKKKRVTVSSTDAAKVNRITKKDIITKLKPPGVPARTDASARKQRWMRLPK